VTPPVNAGYARGAAVVQPQPQRRPGEPYRPPAAAGAPAPQQPGRNGLLIAALILLVIAVLGCAGLLGYLTRQGKNSLGPTGGAVAGQPEVTVAVAYAATKIPVGVHRGGKVDDGPRDD
jgi:hypothetical protein